MTDELKYTGYHYCTKAVVIIPQMHFDADAGTVKLPSLRAILPHQLEQYIVKPRLEMTNISHNDQLDSRCVVE